MLLLAVEQEAPKVLIIGPWKINNVIKKHVHIWSSYKSYKKKSSTFARVVGATLEVSTDWFSKECRSRTPLAFASILIPFSLVDTASSIPSLLNWMQGVA